MLGTIVNVITVIIGGTIGSFFGNRIRPEYSETFISLSPAASLRRWCWKTRSSSGTSPTTTSC